MGGQHVVVCLVLPAHPVVDIEDVPRRRALTGGDFIASQIESSCNQPASSSCAKALANVDLPDPAEPATRNS